MTTSLLHDRSVEDWFDRVRKRHRQAQQAKRSSLRAKREAQRTRAVQRAEMAASGYCRGIADLLLTRPTFADWWAAYQTCFASSAADGRLAEDLLSLTWTHGPALALPEVENIVIEASIACSDVIASTSRSRSPASGIRGNMPRKRKKQARRDAHRNLDATLSALNVAIVAVLNQPQPELEVVAGGALRRQ